MDNSQPSRRLQIATQIASDVVGIAKTYFDNRHTLDVHHKSASQAVTQADLEVETAIRDAMSKHFPGEAIVGEEFGGHGVDSFWTIDPIDGTANFLNGLPFWGIAIGHMSNEVPDLGVIVLPELNVVLAAEENRLFLNGSHVMHCPAPVPTISLGQAHNAAVPGSLALHQSYRDAGFAVYHWRSSAVSLAWTALGRVSGHLHEHTTLWDAVPGAAVCRAAGLDVRMGKGSDHTLWIKAGEPEVHTIAGALWESEESRSR